MFPDTAALLVTLAGALLAGFTTGFAGFGTGLVASGLWYYALPAAMVPPLVAMTSVAGQLVGLWTFRRALQLRSLGPYLGGAFFGIPAGVALLAIAAPDLLKLLIGLFLLSYALIQLSGVLRHKIGGWGGWRADFVIGVGGGLLGGFAGLSGPIPTVWLQLRGGPTLEQRAIYQPFNLIVLALSVGAMAFAGAIDQRLLLITGCCIPLTLTGAWLGVQLYSRVSDAVFRTVILLLLGISGAGLILTG